MIPEETNCILVKKTGVRPFKRCLYCDKRLRECFGFETFFIILGILFLLVIMFTIRDLPVLAIDISVLILLMIVLLGFIANRETNEIIIGNRLLKELNLELEHRVEQRTKELQLVNFELQKALRIKADFLKNMSHELKTPLTAILGYCDIFAEKQTGDLNGNQHKYLTSIQRNGQELLTLIHDLLDLSRIEANKLTIEEKWFDINKIVSEATVSVEYLANKKNIDIIIVPDSNLSRIYADHEHIKQILVNLLSNAVKCTNSGGKVYVEIHDGQNEFSISVKDTGTGIRKEDLETIFEQFNQIDSAATKQYGGTGIGLSIVKSLVEALGGNIHIESEVGKGSIFTFTIPKKVPSSNNS